MVNFDLLWCSSLSAGVDSDASPEMVSDSDAEPVEAENPCARSVEDDGYDGFHVSAAKTDGFLPWFYHTYINSIHIYIYINSTYIYIYYVYVYINIFCPKNEGCWA
jgi:hypothetical protein